MKTSLKITLIALLWLVVVNSGTISVDTAARLQMAHALWTGTEEISLPPDYQPQVRGDAGILGVDGKRYYYFDMGQPLLMVPGDWVGTKLHQIFPVTSRSFLQCLAVNFLVFIPLNVAAVVACFWLLKLFDFSERIAGLASLTWLLSTTVLHYAQINQQNNQVLLFVTLGYATALAYIKKENFSFILLSGLALGAAVLIRYTSVIYVLTLLLFVVGCLVYQRRKFLKVLPIIIWWILGFMPLFLVGKMFNYIRFGSFWTTAANLSMKQAQTDPIYSGLPQFPPHYPWINPPHVGILGVLLSPAKSLFIYDPLLLPCLVLGIFLWKRLSPYIQWYLVTAIFNLSLFIVSMSRLDFWHGDAAWGARYHVTSLHLLFIPLIALFVQYLLKSTGIRRWFLSGIIALAIMVQIASVILHPTADTGRIYLAKPSSFSRLRLGTRIRNLGCLINPDFSQYCPRELGKAETPLMNKIALLPFAFTQSRELILIIWGLILVAAIASTWHFCWVGD